MQTFSQNNFKIVMRLNYFKKRLKAHTNSIILILVQMERKLHMNITIKDVARKAGVAPSTVSRVIADSPSISEKTKQNVRRIMDELNYFPNANAQGLASNRSKTFGLILPVASDAFYQNPFFPTVMRGINYAMSKDDYSILISSGQTNQQRLNHIKKIVNGKQVEGLIFLYASKKDPLLDFALKDGIPTVVIGTPDHAKVH